MQPDEHALAMITIQPGGLRYDCVDSMYLDCLADNLAVLLHYHGVQDLRTPFAFQWYFDFDPDQNTALPRLERIPITEAIEQQTGYKLEYHVFDGARFLQQCSDLIRRQQPLLLFGDTYYMPWLPYAGHEHQEHTFIIDGISADQSMLHIVDAYYNKTEWGAATPTDTLLSSADLGQIIGSLETQHAQSFITSTKMTCAPPIDLAAVLRCNAEQILLQVGKKGLIRCFSRYYAERVADVPTMKQFTVACWLAARARALHSLWLDDSANRQPNLVSAALVEQFHDVTKAWQRVSEFAYILFRRISHGRSAPLSCFGILEQVVHPSEVRIAEQLCTSLQSN